MVPLASIHDFFSRQRLNRCDLGRGRCEIADGHSKQRRSISAGPWSADHDRTLSRDCLEYGHGPACVLEGLSQAVVGVPPDRLVSGEFGARQAHQLNKSTGNRIKYRKIDAETGDEVNQADIIKGYEDAATQAMFTPRVQ
jgi:hypothetical protein